MRRRSKAAELKPKFCREAAILGAGCDEAGADYNWGLEFLREDTKYDLEGARGPKSNKKTLSYAEKTKNKASPSVLDSGKDIIYRLDAKSRA